MKHKLLLIFLFFSLFFHCKVECQDFQWVRQVGNQQTDEAEAIEVDNDGNSYFIGVAQSYTYDLDPTPSGTQIIDNTGGQGSPYRDIYLIKLKNNGDFAWGKTFGNVKSGQYAYEIKIGPNGDIYVFLQTTESTGSNQAESFTTIVKITPDGNELSRIKIKNPGSFYTDSFAIDNQNNILVSGWFVNSQTVNFSNQSVKFESQNSIASFIFKLDNSGNFIWKKIFDYPELANVSIQTRPDGNIIAVLSTSFQGYPMSSILNINTSNTDIVWEKKLSQQAISSFHLDRKGNIVIAGTNGVYEGIVDVDPSSNVRNTSSQKFLLWLDYNGNFLDLKEYFLQQYKEDFQMTKIASDEQNNIYLVGYFNGKVDADPSSNEFFLENPLGRIQYGSGYAIKFDYNRAFVTAYSLLSNYRTFVNDIKVRNKSIYLLGDFNGECDFDPGVGIQTFDSLHDGAVLSSDGFVVKLSPCDPTKPYGDENQSFCNSHSSTIADLVPNFTGIKWYDSASNGNILSSATYLENGKTYYASQTLNNCEVERLAVTVSIKTKPSVPQELNNRTFCKYENATLNDLHFSGENLKWYDSNTSTTPLINTTLLQDNTTYFVSQTSGCESDRAAIIVKIFDTAAPVGEKEQTFCIDQNTTIAAIKIRGENLLWYDALNGGNHLAETTILQNSTYYVSQTLNDCESKRIPVEVKLKKSESPVVDANQQFCSQEKASLKDIKITGQNIKWFETSTSNSNLPESSLLRNGTYYVSQTINQCESNRIPVTIQIMESTTADCSTLDDELPYPKFFTPNNDGYNDTWTIDFTYLAPNTGIRIFDRYGKLLKELHNNDAWNGTYIGRNEPASDYWFTVTRLNGTEFRGHFSLKR